MPGGLLQLNAYGAQNQYLNGNPQMTFFKVVYRRYTNFSSEYIRQDATGPNTLADDVPIQLYCKIDRNGDLIQQVYFVFDIPDIYSAYDWESAQELILTGRDPVDSIYKFSWVANLGTTIINWVNISIGGQEIDKQYGEWMNVWAELNLHNSQLDGYNQMTGNLPDLFAPEISPGANGFYPTSSLNPNLNTDYQIPEVLRNDLNPYLNPYLRPPSIKGRKIYVPLNFWFCNNPGLSLPLIALQYHDIYLKIELRPLNEIYTIIETDPYSAALGFRVKPNQLRQKQAIGNFITQKKDWNYNVLIQDTSNNYINSEDNMSWDLNPHFLINYYFLDKQERERFAAVTHEYLITQIYTSSFFGVVGSETMELKLHQPCKQLIWTTKRSDLSVSFNQWTNYTNWWREQDPRTQSEEFFQKTQNIGISEAEVFYNLLPNKESQKFYNENILVQARLLFEGEERFAPQQFGYFNYLQPYEYNIRTPKNGIYVFSFSVEKENYQPSGACNMARIKKIQLEVDTNEIPTRTNPNETLQFYYGYNFNVYAVNYNILRIMGGMGGLVFTN